jgi:N utilization substance protein A
MAVLSDFLAAVNQIAAERGIQADEVVDAVKESVRTGFKKDYGEGESLVVELDEDKGEIKVYADKKVVKKVSNSATQISLADAKMFEPKLKAGDHVQVDITPEGDVGRIAVQAAKQVILQKVREAEKEAVIKEFKDKVGTVESGIVQRMEGDNVIVEIRKAQSIMPAEERLPGEYYRSGERLKFYLKKIQKTVRGKQLIVSRSDPNFLEDLFALEVPEIRSGSVEIKAIAREAGSRSKVAVVSNQEGVDPIGACVGQKGIRIDNITDELKGEKIDIIIWDEEIQVFIANSLSPAQVGKIKINKKEEIAEVIVPDDQLSLAIGKEGQNVRLAAKLTGWKIDIKGKGEGKKAKGKKGKAKGKKKKEKAEKKVKGKKGKVKGKKAKAKGKKSEKKVAKKKVEKKKAKKKVKKETKASKKKAEKAKGKKQKAKGKKKKVAKKKTEKVKGKRQEEKQEEKQEVGE